MTTSEAFVLLFGRLKKSYIKLEARMSSSDLLGCGTANTRSSPKRIADVVSKFGSFKRKLVSEISFQGMLKLPEIDQLDMKLTMSILNRIDTKKRAIKINDTCFIDITASDVHRYLDIPIGPNKLFGLEDRSPSEKMDFIRFGIGSSSFDIDETNSLKAAEEIVTADYPNGMNENQIEQFKVSFVCFCMGNFLIAKYSSNHGLKDYWGSLMKPSGICSYNFCQAVVDEIVECARHVQRETKANRKIKNVSGCNLFLQAKFLDSVNLGVLNILASAIPRIEVFTCEVLQQMVHAADSKAITTVGVHNTSPELQEVNQLKHSSLQKSISQNPIMNTSLYTPAKPASTEYLACYTRGDIEKKLNDKQIDDLRLHNARMKLFINNFKSKHLAEIYSSDLHNKRSKENFISNVDLLMIKVLDQVLVLSKSLHEHSEVHKMENLTTPSLHISSKIIPDTRMSGYGSSKDHSPFKRPKTGFLPTGKNILHDLAKVAEKTPLACHQGSSTKVQFDSSFHTPDNQVMKQNHVDMNTEGNASGYRIFNCSNNNAATTSVFDASSGSLKTDKFRTPINLLKISSDSLSDGMKDSDEYRKEIDLNETPINDDITYSPMPKKTITKGRMARNPWFYALPRKVVDKEVADTFFNWLGVTKSESLDSLWINHSGPRRLQIAGNDFKSVFTRGYNFTNDLLDLAIRRFGQMDRNMYGDRVNLRWMHPFESDFAS